MISAKTQKLQKNTFPSSQVKHQTSSPATGLSPLRFLHKRIKTSDNWYGDRLSLLLLLRWDEIDSMLVSEWVLKRKRNMNFRKTFKDQQTYLICYWKLDKSCIDASQNWIWNRRRTTVAALVAERDRERREENEKTLSGRSVCVFARACARGAKRRKRTQKTNIHPALPPLHVFKIVKIIIKTNNNIFFFFQFSNVVTTTNPFLFFLVTKFRNLVIFSRKWKTKKARKFWDCFAIFWN